MRSVVSNTVGWLAGSLFGAAKPEQRDMSEDESEDEQPRSANDETVNYEEEMEEEEGQGGEMQFAAEMEEEDRKSSSRNARQISHATPAPSSRPPLPSPAPAATPAPSFGILRTPFGRPLSPAPLSTPALAQARPFAASPAPTAAARAVPLSFAASPAPRASPTPAAAPSAPPSPSDLLRTAFHLFQSGSADSSSARLTTLHTQLGGAGSGELDSLVLSLARRVGDSRHVTSQRMAFTGGADEQGGEEESAFLTTELTQKAETYEGLLRFVRHPLVRATGAAAASTSTPYVSLWSLLSHSTQHALLTQGEFIHLALSLKQLLNTPASSFPDGSGAGVVVDAVDQRTVDLRRAVMLECMHYMVHQLRWQHGAEGLVKEGLSVQEIFFSETSKLPEIFTAIQAVLDLNDKPSTRVADDMVSLDDLLRLHGAASLLHCVMVSSSSFRSLPSHATLYSQLNLPNGLTGEIPALSWMLEDHVRVVIKQLSKRMSEQIIALRPGVRVTGLPVSSDGVSGALFNVQAFQVQMFDHLYRMCRVYLTQYTEFLSLVSLLRSHTTPSTAVLELESSLHEEFVADRQEVLRGLESASGKMNEFNRQLTAVFQVPAEGLPGVPAQKLPPYQALYDFAQEFQDLSALVGLSLSEPVHDVSDRRLVYFLSEYGFPFLRQLFEEQMTAGEIKRLLELAPVARQVLPTYLAHKAESLQSDSGLTLPDSSGRAVPIGVDGTLETDGRPVYDAWLAELLKPYPQFAWLHDLQMEQYAEAHTILRQQAHGEKSSLQHKKQLLSLSKLSLLASAEEFPQEPLRMSSDASTLSSDGVNAHELQALDDQLYVVLAQEFVGGEQEGKEEEEGASAPPQPVLPPQQLIDRLLQVGLDPSTPSSIHLHSFCFSFLSVEKSLLPKSRTAPFDSFSAENQQVMTHIWRAILQADEEQWPALAAKKAADATDEWQSDLTSTHLYNVCRELMTQEQPFYEHEEVYSQSFRAALKHSQQLPVSLRANDVRVVMENTYSLAKSHFEHKQ